MADPSLLTQKAMRELVRDITKFVNEGGRVVLEPYQPKTFEIQ